MRIISVTNKPTCTVFLLHGFAIYLKHGYQGKIFSTYKAESGSLRGLWWASLAACNVYFFLYFEENIDVSRYFNFLNFILLYNIGKKLLTQPSCLLLGGCQLQLFPALYIAVQ